MKKIDLILKAMGASLRERLPRLFHQGFLSDINVQVMVLLFAIVLATLWITSAIRFGPVDFLVPVRYNSFLGVTQLGAWYQLYYVVGLLTICGILNLALANVIYKKDKMVSYILVGANLFLAVAAASVIINLVIINGA